MSDQESASHGGQGKHRVPPLNMTSEERRTLLHCIVAGEDDAIEHFGEEEAERIESLKDKLGYSK